MVYGLTPSSYLLSRTHFRRLRPPARKAYASESFALDAFDPGHPQISIIQGSISQSISSLFCYNSIA